MKPLLISLPGAEHFDHRLHGGDTMKVRFSADAVIARLARHEPDARQGPQRRIERHHLARLGPRAVDDDQRLGRSFESVGRHRSGTGKQQGRPGSGQQFLNAWVTGKFNPLMEFAAG